jgi:hypothetical protein
MTVGKQVIRATGIMACLPLVLQDAYGYVVARLSLPVMQTAYDPAAKFCLFAYFCNFATSQDSRNAALRVSQYLAGSFTSGQMQFS